MSTNLDSEFSLDGYRRLIEGFKEAGYLFCNYEETLRLQQDQCPYIVLRHDVDIDLQLALELASIEHELGVQSTYFVSLRSPLYNVLCRAAAQLILHIHQLGHDIAAHVDPALYGGDFEETLSEIDVLARYYPYMNTQIMSLHHPGNLHQLTKMLSVKSIDNVYGAILKGEATYISDSTGRWRYGCPFRSEGFLSRKSVHLLTHPIWWIQNGETPLRKLKSWLECDHAVTSTAIKEFLPTLFASAEAREGLP